MHVVTRNSFREDIVAFLEQHGLGREDVPIHTVKKGQSKADVIQLTTSHYLAASKSGVGARVMFVDDSIEELIEEQTPRHNDMDVEVLRVLFVRGH